MTAEVITYRPRSAVRDVGKALGLSLDRSTGWPSRSEHYARSGRARGNSELSGFRLPSAAGCPNSGDAAWPSDLLGLGRRACSAFPGICRSTSAAWS